MKNLIIALLCLASLVVLVRSENMITPKSWLTSCKACTNQMQECSVCIRDGCDECFRDIQDTNCQKCAADIKRINLGSFYCDNTFEYHQLVCLISCRWRNNIPFFQTGSCDNYTGKCVCA